MTHDEFWQLIDKTRAESGNNPTKQAELLVKALTAMPVEDIIDYQRIHDVYFTRAFRTDLWDVAYIIGKGCSDDGFKDFKGWLIGQGLSTYERALYNPDTLAHIVTIEERYDTQTEELLYVAEYTYENKTNTIDGIPPDKLDLTSSKLNRNSPCFSIKEAGDDMDDCFKKHYPNIWAKFGW